MRQVENKIFHSYLVDEHQQSRVVQIVSKGPNDKTELQKK